MAKITSKKSASAQAQSADTVLAKSVRKQKKVVEIQQYWDNLSSRDRLALILLVLFMIVIVGGLGGYNLRQSATQQTTDYQDAINDYFWLRGQAGNVDANAVQGEGGVGDVASIEAQVNEYLQQSGARNPHVIKNGDNVEISFTHPNQAVASKIVAGFTEQGLDIVRLDMRQDSQDKSIQVQATLSP